MALIVATYTYLKNKIHTFNLFEDVEEEDLENQRTATWMFLILLLLSIFSLLLYASLVNVTKTVVIQQPTVAVYKDLQSKYPNTLVCPCQQILNKYNTFIVSFAAKFNQICSSNFVGEQWLKYVNYRLQPQMEYHYIFDFRHSAYSFFQMLHTLCILVSQTIHDQLIEFYATTLLTETLFSEETFLALTLASKDQFLNTTASSFQTSLNSLRTIVQADNIANRLETNYYIAIAEYEGASLVQLGTRRYPPNGCSCLVSSYCNTTTGIFSVIRKSQPSYEAPDYPYMPTMAFFRIHLLFHVPGVNVGCSVLDAVLQSNLSCLYNSSCLSQLNTYLNDSLHPFNATALNVSYSSLPTVNNLVEKLMVDEWLFNASYKSYFSQCNPSACTYTYAIQFDMLFMITTIVSSIGGIVTILMLVSLPLVTITRRFVCRRWPLSVTQIDPVYLDTRNARSLRQHLQSLLSKTKDFAINLNLFKDPEQQSAHELKNQRISTRLFIIAMIIALSILILYTSVAIVTRTVTIKQPKLNVYTELQTKYAQTLICPCTQISVDYKQFISFHPTFHRICSSDFISTQWLKYFTIKNGQAAFALDLRTIGPSYFSTLLTFCNLSFETINNALLVFNSTKYVTKNVQQIDLFQSQIDKIVNLFKQTTTNSYLQALSVGRQMTSGNALFSGLLSNYGFTAINDTSFNLVFYPYTYYPSDSTTCDCKSYPSACGQHTGIGTLSSRTAPELLFSVPGLWYGCYLTESLFGSTFECYFNQSCLNEIYQFTSPTAKYPFNATAIISNDSNTQYEITTSVQKIIEQLMIEQWNEQISFHLYYEQCNPVSCVYTYNTKGDLAYMLTTTIGLIGGLTTLFRIIIPPIIAFLRRKKRLAQPIETDVDGHEHAPSFIGNYIQILKSYVATFNLFRNPNKRSHEQIQYQRMSTRTFIFLFSTSLIVLFLYVSLENVTQTITIRNPSIDQFNLLYQQYSDSLRCPCKTLSIEYQTFIRFDPQFHSVCASEFITSKIWLEIKYPPWKFRNNGVPTFRTHVDDYRQIVSPLFQLLSAFCQLSLQTLNTELLTFNFTTLITPNLVSQRQFQLQTSQLIDQFIENTARSLISTLYLVNNMTFANMLISGLSSDSVLTIYPQYYYDYGDYVFDYIYDRIDQEYNSSLTGIRCDCQENPFCIQQALVYDVDATTILFPVPGIYVGCYLVTALLQSDLRCFYDDLCLQQLMNSLNLSSDTSSLTSSNSIYEVTTTVQEIMSNLMIEQWNHQTTYEDYFNQCQPNECSATYVHRGNIPYIITTMTGLIGGLKQVYIFAVPLLVQITFSLIIRLKRKAIVNIQVAPLETTAREN